MPNKTLQEIVSERPFTDFHEWWKMGTDFVMFMSDAIGTEWRALKHQSGSLDAVERYTEEYHREVFGRQADKSLVEDFVNQNRNRQYYSGEFDALSYAFYRLAFELIATHITEYAHSLEVERRRFTERVGARFFRHVENHLGLDLPSSLDTDAEVEQLKVCTGQVGGFLSSQGYLRDNFVFTFAVHLDYNGKRIDQDDADLLSVLRSKGVAYAIYEMGYPVILPSAVYLYHTIGEAQHHSSRTIEELFKRVGYEACETDDFDPIEYPSDSVVELWTIKPLP